LSSGYVVSFLDFDEKEAKKLQNFLFKRQVKKEFIYTFE
jgi:c-di-GMP-binding flagellar brake protein YcgR